MPVVAGELVDRARADLPELAEHPEREQLRLASWLVSLRATRTRRSYARDAQVWQAWLAAGRVHVDLWVREQRDAGAAASTACRRLSALAS
ncbi:hypothetical protein [Haloechinothrix alba]|uniref:hypothetical protein n=1 Tax=Haloechinothrix alba TaxID=664784 RepID=UPI000B77C569|nr:hypothetical protein [Haloechinothrix alba]